MGTLTMIEFLSADGVMQGLGSPEEDTSGGFTHGGWGAPFAGGIHRAQGSAEAAATAAYLFGRKTYEKMASFWPLQPDSNPMAAHLNAAPKYVASRTLGLPQWQGTARIEIDRPEVVADLKRQVDGDIALLGSGALARDLLAAGLVDRLRLFVHPLLLGSGTRLFGGLPQPRRLTLSSVTATDLGTICVAYDVGAEIADVTLLPAMEPVTQEVGAGR
ncbi:dihydrofolate reductase family protein [Microbacterium sp. zg-YB36]|uniref:dihydrofolate reductase family protein n=1 Tax=Microbacterium sp. zg-YB36 TaxID=2969407 RepID=UPI00214CCEE4|nr:dihydrofolate reductase family protein [Microbacterium sp. zg-YB36]MDL5352856.1 dihydrofolate reductase family protein [Microbacterium sp. zg-YB36]